MSTWKFAKSNLHLRCYTTHKKKEQNSFSGSELFYSEAWLPVESTVFIDTFQRISLDYLDASDSNQLRI